MADQPSRPLAEPALMGELRSVEVVDFLDPAELETDGLIDFGHGYDDEDHAVEFVHTCGAHERSPQVPRGSGSLNFSLQHGRLRDSA